MITLSVQIGSTTFAGLTFSTGVNQVDNVEIMISNLGSLTSQFVSMMMENRTEQNVLTTNTSENFGTDLDISIILQADSDTDVSYDLSKFLGIKSIFVEMLP